MQRAAAVVSALAVLVAAANLSAQQPNFSGQWALVAPAAGVGVEFFGIAGRLTRITGQFSLNAPL